METETCPLCKGDGRFHYRPGDAGNGAISCMVCCGRGKVVREPFPGSFREAAYSDEADAYRERNGGWK